MTMGIFWSQTKRKQIGCIKGVGKCFVGRQGERMNYSTIVDGSGNKYIIDLSLAGAENRNIIARVARYGDPDFSLLIESSARGWDCFATEAADPRNRIRGHPVSKGDITEISMYPVYLGCYSGQSFPSAQRVAQWMNGLEKTETNWRDFETYADWLYKRVFNRIFTQEEKRQLNSWTERLQSLKENNNAISSKKD